MRWWCALKFLDDDQDQQRKIPVHFKPHSYLQCKVAIRQIITKQCKCFPF